MLRFGEKVVNLFREIIRADVKFPETNLAAAYRKEQLPKVPLTELIELLRCVSVSLEILTELTDLQNCTYQNVDHRYTALTCLRNNTISLGGTSMLTSAVGNTFTETSSYNHSQTTSSLAAT